MAICTLSPCRRRGGARRLGSRHCRRRRGSRARRSPPPSSAPRRGSGAPRRASASCRCASGGELLVRLLLDEGAPHAVKIEPAHHRRLAHVAHAGGALLVGGGELLDDLVALLAVLDVGGDVDGEEGDLLLAEAVLLEQRRRGLAVDARHLALEANQQARQRLDERLARLDRAPALQAERLGQQLAFDLRVEDLLTTLAADLTELE